MYLDLAWGDMSAREQQLWERLGWTGRMWDSTDENDTPDSEFKTFDELTPDEQDAVRALGYTADSWDNIDDYCSN